MGVPGVRPIPSLAERIASLLDRVDYRPANTGEVAEDVYRLRYDAYIREGTISPNPSQRLSDRFDGTANAMTFALYIDDRLASSIRLHVASRDHPDIPANQVFGDILEPEIAAGRKIIDPTRFVCDAEMGRLYPQLPFLTVRIGFIAGEFFAADSILATVRAEHRAFYQRIFGHKPLADPRPYPSLLKPICLMALDYPAQRQTVIRRYPFFASTYFERRMLFDPAGKMPRPTAQIIQHPDLEMAEQPSFAG